MHLVEWSDDLYLDQINVEPMEQEECEFAMTSDLADLQIDNYIYKKEYCDQKAKRFDGIPLDLALFLSIQPILCSLCFFYPEAHNFIKNKIKTNTL